MRLDPLFLAFAVLAGSTLSAGSASGPATARVECRWTDAPPVIDGRGDDAVWSRAQIVSDFRQAWREGKPAAKEGTRARLLWDREWIYFLAEMDDADVSADSREHDGPLWRKDVFEIFLKPSPDHAGYFEFEVNPAEAVLDAFYPTAESRRAPGQLRRGEFHVEAKVVVRGTLNEHGDRDKGWTVEGRIPWSDFNATGSRPAPGEIWSANLARVNGPGEAGELSSAVPLAKLDFHRTAEFLPLRFVGPEPLVRPRWENTRLDGSPDGAPQFVTTRAFPRLQTGSVVMVEAAPDRQWIWFVDQEPGWDGRMRLRRVRAGGDGTEAETLLEPDELLYSLTFHPRFAENGFVYIGMNGPRGERRRSSLQSRVVRYTVREGRPVPESRLVIIEWPSAGHNGAAVAFGGDGMLYVTSGDGTSDGDSDRVGQDPLTLRAKVLRIDVDHPAAGKGYAVPPDNPFVGDARFAPETWAYGLRNPWRLTYDPPSGQMWLGENGQDRWEYARLVQRGANYGWSVYEGSHLFGENRPRGPHPVTFPTLEFSHAEFRSLSGGVVYRGKKFPELVGAYVFGDFGTGRVWAAKHDGTRVEWTRELVDTPFAITHVSPDADGELLLADYGSPVSDTGATGAIHRVERAPVASVAAADFPRRLSDTGIFSDVKTMTPVPGVLRYEINSPGWHDGASEEHWLAVPGAAAIEVRPSKSWRPPDGTVLAQTLVMGGRRVETRILVKRPNDCAGYTYVWNAAQTEATLAEKEGADLVLAGGRPWRVPSRAECAMCHTREANFCLTLHEAQLNRGDQLARWERLGLLQTDLPAFERRRRRTEGLWGQSRMQQDQRAPSPSPLLPRDPSRLLRFAAPGDNAASLELRARSYLGVNCAHCHTVSGGGNSAMDFDWMLPARSMRAIGQRPEHGNFGATEARIIAPGAPALSVVLPRMGTRGPGQMPPLGTRVEDVAGMRVLAEWIASLKE